MGTGACNANAYRTKGAQVADALFTFDAEPIRPGNAARPAGYRIGGAIAAAVAVAIGTVRTITVSGVPARALPFAAMGVAGAVAALAVAVKRRQLRAGSTDSARIALSGDGVTLTSALQVTMIQWAAVRIEERRNEFVFYLPEAQTVRVRKTAISEAQGVERLRSFLMGQVGTRAKLLS